MEIVLKIPFFSCQQKIVKIKKKSQVCNRSLPCITSIAEVRDLTVMLDCNFYLPSLYALSSQPISEPTKSY